MDCPDENTLADLVASRVGERRGELELHLSTCAECRAVVSELVKERVPAALATVHGTASFVHLPGHTEPTPPARTFSDEEVVADRYRVVRFVASGGMGEVYEAEDRELHSRVALKAIRSHIAADRRVLDRFKREIMIARRVTHPNVCRIFDVGFHTRGGERVTFLTMELLAGETLAARLHRAGRMSAEDALPLVEQMVAALGAAHAAGVIHRDFKSANVMLVSSETGARAVITDFGLARGEVGTPEHGGEPKEHGVQGTGQRELVGTPAYMAPEQVALLEVTAAADVYALGVVMFEMLTARLPFVGATPMLTAVRRLHEPAPSPRAWVPDVPASWERAIGKCLEREPADRFARVADVIATLASHEPQPSPYLGKTVNNHVLRRKLGDGVAPVFLAEHPRIDRRVAVQIFPASLDVAWVARCFADIAAASAAHHPHVVEIFDFGALPEGGSYLMSEWSAGRSLAALLHAETRLPFGRALRLLRGVGDALATLHARGVVHGGLTTESIVVADEVGKVGGFGLARLTDAPIEPRADVDALAAIVVELVTGLPPAAAHDAFVATTLPPHAREALLPFLPGHEGRRASTVSELLTALEPAPSHRGPRGARAFGWVAAGLVVAVAALIGHQALAPKPAPIVAAPVRAPSPSPAAVVAVRPLPRVAAPPMVHIHVGASPATAELRLDGQAVTNPYDATVAAAAERHAFSVRAPGRRTLTRTIAFDRDQSIDVALPAPPRERPKPESTPLMTEYPE